MLELIACPVCTLYLRPGMALEDHLETHPKEQVIKALVSLALGATNHSSQQNQNYETPSCGNFSDSNNVGGYPQQPQTTQFIFTPPPPPPRPNVMIVNRQSTMVYHTTPPVVASRKQPPPERIDAESNFIASPQLQIFALPHHTQTPSSRLPPPPAYGTAINQLRSQQNQNQVGLQAQPISPQYQSQHHRNSPQWPNPSSSASCPDNISSFERLRDSPQLTQSSQSSQSPRPPSVLRYAESPISAQYVERENGDFIVQESPRHVVECVETENGEFSVIEKVIQSPPSVVQFNDCDKDYGSDTNNENEECNASDNENYEFEELPAASPPQFLPESNIDEVIEENVASVSKGSGIKDVTVISNVKLDPNESLEIMENLENMKSSMQGELIWSGLAEFSSDISNRMENTGSSCEDQADAEEQPLPPAATSSATSVIRLASKKSSTSHHRKEIVEKPERETKKELWPPPITKRPYKKQPKKLTVKFKVAVPGIGKGVDISKSGTSSTNTYEADTQVQTSSVAVNLTTDRSEQTQPPDDTSPVVQTSTINNASEETESKSAVTIEATDNAIDVSNSISPIPKEETDPSPAMIKFEEAQPMIVHEPSLSQDLAYECPPRRNDPGVDMPERSLATVSQMQNPNPNFEQICDAVRRELEFSKLLDEVCAGDPNKHNLFSLPSSSVDTTTGSNSSESIDQMLSNNLCNKTIVDITTSSTNNFDAGAFSSECPSSSSSSCLSSMPSTSSFALQGDASITNKEAIADDKTSVQQHPPNEFNATDYSFGLLYEGAGSGETQPWSRYITQQQMSQFQELDTEHSNYMDLDTYKITSCHISVPNIHADEKMPAKGEISEQESNGDVDNSWSNPNFGISGFRITNTYENYKNSDWIENTDGVIPLTHDFATELKTDSAPEPNDLSVVGRKDILQQPLQMPALPAGTNIKVEKTIPCTRRVKQFQCTHCELRFPLLKERNAHLIETHGYKRVNRRLVRETPPCTVTTENLATITPSTEIPTALAGNVTITPSCGTDPIDDVKPDIKPDITVTSSTIDTNLFPRTKYDTIRAGVYSMLINFNLNVLKMKKVEFDESYFEAKSFFCMTCKRSFVSVKLYDEHLAEHPAECYTCGRKFSRWTYFSLHLKRHLGWKDFACSVCEKKFVTRSELVEHMRMHTGVSPLKCNMCEKSFKRYSNLRQHKKVCHSNRASKRKDYVCYCGEVLPSKARFLWHKETHETKPKVCPYCRDRFVHRRSLKRHIRLTHSEKFQYAHPVKCKECKQVYAKASMRAHMLTHSIDTQHECSICNKTFTTKWNLKIHSWVHTNRAAKPFKCEHCIKAFVREIDYKNHINSHRNIKPYTCEFCGCKFIRKYNYMRHRKEHTAQKSFKCDLCGKMFHRNYYLIEHRRMHTGERPFLCTICGKSSTTKTNHNKHLKIHHSRDPFTSEV